MNAINPIAAETELDHLLGDIAKAGNQTRTTSETLPPSAYCSPEFFALESEKIFRDDWVCIGHARQVPNVGDYFTVDLVGEALVVVRTPTGVKTLSRACLHRWAPVVSGAGNTKAFVCPFHKWVYNLDGQLAATPFMEEAENFEPGNCRLPEFRTEIPPDLGFIFVNLSGEAEPLEPRLESFSRKYANWKIGELDIGRVRTNEMSFNWKIQIETFMECYHHIGVHPTTFEAIQPARLSSCEDGEAGWTVCHSPYKPSAPAEVYTSGLPVCPDLTEAELRTCDYVLIYPNLLLAIRPDTVAVIPVLPTRPDHCTTISFQLVRPEALAEPGLMERIAEEKKDFMDLVTKEDTEINALQQATLQSRYARPGRLSQLETTVWDLANYVRARVAG